MSQTLNTAVPADLASGILSDLRGLRGLRENIHRRAGLVLAVMDRLEQQAEELEHLLSLDPRESARVNLQRKLAFAEDKLLRRREEVNGLFAQLREAEELLLVAEDNFARVTRLLTNF